MKAQLELKSSKDNSTTHNDLVARIRLALGTEKDLVLWPNAVKHLQAVTKGGDLTHMRTGLCPGSSDLVGIGPGGRFVGLEVKTGRVEVKAHQTLWLQLVRDRGGFAAVVTSVEDAKAALDRCRRGEKS